MTGGVGVFRTEGRTKGIDVLKGHGKGFAIELTGYSQVGGLAVEVLREVYLTIFGLGHVIQVQGGNLEHLTGTLTVRAGNQRGVHIYKVPVLEELVNGHSSQAAHTEYCLKGVGARAQMGNGAQKFHCMTFGLQRVIAGGSAFHSHFAGLNFKRLRHIGGLHHSAPDD